MRSSTSPAASHLAISRITLVLAWQTLNRICAKRLIPFLPSIIDSLEQHGHVRLSEESRDR